MKNLRTILLAIGVGINKNINQFIGYSSKVFERTHPAKLTALGYFLYLVVGWALLDLPFVQKGPGVSSLDNLFISMSALSTTGLSTVSVSDGYNGAGQAIILALIQVGGIGYMTLGSFVLLSRKGRLSEVRSKVATTVFSLPESFQIEKFIRSVIKFTLVIEALGAACLYPLFSSAGSPAPLWSAVFHSVSAFCTAGFGLYNNSFESYVNHFWVNVILAAESYLGAIGFIVCVDWWRMARGKVSQITLTSKIILWTTFWLSLIGTIQIFLQEPSLQAKPVAERLLAAFFQAMAALTTVGFNSIPIGGLSKASALMLVILMVIGASPAGTGGGLKSTTFSALIGVMRSALRGDKQVTFWARPVPLERVWTAVASLGFYLFVLILGTMFLDLTESSAFDQNLFEAASALGTVGLSMGITAGLTEMGKIIIILLMYCGRVGPLTFGVALFTNTPTLPEPSDNDLAV